MAEKGLDWTGRTVDVVGKENLSEPYLKLNPKGVIPTLVDDGEAIIESTFINEYLDDRYPDPPLRPNDPVARARMRLWPRLVDDEVHTANAAITWPILIRPVWQRLEREEIDRRLKLVPDPARRKRQESFLAHGLQAPEFAAALRVFLAAFRKADAALEADYLCGDRMSLADCALLPYAQSLYQYGIHDKFFARFPRVGAWFDRCRTRPSWENAIVLQATANRWREIRAAGEAVRPHIEAELAKIGGE